MTHRPQSILIVEDEGIVAMDIQHRLEDLGYDSPRIASSLEEALACAREKCPDLVLMDIRIKGERDGIQVAEALQSEYSVPIVYLTAHADASTFERAIKTRPYGYLIKPVKSAELRSAVETSLYRHEMETQLRNRDQWFSTTLQSIADGVITADIDDNVTFMNRAAEGLTGTPADVASGKPVSDLLRFGVAEEGGRERALVSALPAGGSVEIRERTLENLANGAVRLVDQSVATVADSSQRTLGTVMVLHDVTEQRKLRKQAELANRLASLGTMAAGVAHEVNNPLAILSTSVAFVLDELVDLRSEFGSGGPLSDKSERRMQVMTEALTDAVSACKRIGGIVSGLGAFSRPPEAPDQSADIVRCIEWAIRTTTHEFSGRARLVTKFGTASAVQGDELKLGQVIINLLVNAAHAIPPGHLEDNEVTIETRVDEYGQIIVEVRDTGVGIAPDLLPRILEPFYTTKAVGVGTGLGLSICHGIVSSVGGQMQVESKLGRGTLVRLLLLPAATEAVCTEAPRASVDALPGRILVIDDETLLLHALSRVLSQYEVCCVTSAEDAFALMNKGETFDVILTDVMMPTMTGIQFYQSLVITHPDLADRVIFLSGAITSRVAEFLHSIPNFSIGKPFDLNRLKEAIKLVLENKTGSSTRIRAHYSPTRGS